MTGVTAADDGRDGGHVESIPAASYPIDDDDDDGDRGHGGSDALFQRAIVQSPGWLPPPPDRGGQEGVFRAFLYYAGVNANASADGLAALRRLPSERLVRANAAHVAAVPFGTFAYGPVVDGGLVRADPKAVLGRGYGEGGRGGGGWVGRGGVQAVLTGRSANEGRAFVPPGLRTERQFERFVRAAGFGGGGRGDGNATTADAVDYIVNELYPPVYNGTGALYADVRERAALLLGEALFACNAFALNAAFAAGRKKTLRFPGRRLWTSSYAYLFDVPPAVHGQAVPYTFCVPGRAPDADGVVNATVAGVLQDYVASFAASGVPESSTDGLAAFKQYGSRNRTVRMGEEGFEVVTDPAANNRCLWWIDQAASKAR